MTLVINLFVIPPPEDKRMELYMREVKTKTDDLPMDVAVPTKPVSASHPTRLCCAVDKAARSFHRLAGRPAANPQTGPMMLVAMTCVSITLT